MDYLVLDTDAASHLQRGSLPQNLQHELSGKTLCVTFVTVAEFFKGAFEKGWGERRIEQLEQWLRGVVVLPYTSDVSRAWGRISAEGTRKGRQVPVQDGWIAACCVSYQVPLMTLNRRHFEDIDGLVLVPPANSSQERE